MPVKPRVLMFDTTVNCDLVARSILGGSPHPGEAEWWAERGCFVSNSLTSRPRHRWIVDGEEIA